MRCGYWVRVMLGRGVIGEFYVYVFLSVFSAYALGSNLGFIYPSKYLEACSRPPYSGRSKSPGLDENKGLLVYIIKLLYK